MVQAQRKRRAIDWKRIEREARSRFGIERLTPEQREIMGAALEGRNVLGVLPTGAGKSLCFQLPALTLKKPVVVVSPLIALMQDQQARADEADLVATRIDSTLRKAESEEAHAQIAEGSANLIYTTPEQLEKPEFLRDLKKKGVALLVVDEAHCISQWGHDFRPAYLGLREATAELGQPPVMALTATATQEVALDILNQLGLTRTLIVNRSIERKNLQFAVVSTGSAEEKREALLPLVRSESVGIIYCATVRAANELYGWLCDQGVNAERYHGRLPKGKRREALESFMEDRCRVVVATKAFGLGIDKPDVRYVAHYQFPESLESYYQEAGRAGRDGADARCVLLYRAADKRVQTYFMAGKYPPAEEAAKFYAVLRGMAENSASQDLDVREAAIATAIGEKRAKVIVHMLIDAELARRTRKGIRLLPAGDEEQARTVLREFEHLANGDRERLDTMIAYAQTALCRLRFLRRYFGENVEEDCGNCDNCRRKAVEPELPTNTAQTKVVAVQTPAADLQTTVPESLPSPPAFQPGDRVRHRRFGIGRVLSADTDRLAIDFEKAGQKEVKPTFVRSVA